MARRADYCVADTRPRGLGKRHTLAILGFFGFALSYSMRFSLSIAIVEMVSSNDVNKPSQAVHDIMFRKDICTRNLILHNHPSLNATQDLDDLQYIIIPHAALKNVTNYEIDAEDDPLFQESSENLQKNVTQSTQDPSGEFNWSGAEQGFILSSFFYGYILTQIPGGWLGHRFGGKWPFGVGLFITALLSIATPFFARWGGFRAIVMVRVLQGFAGGVTVPCMHTLLARWIPPDERGQLTAVVYAGMSFGAAISLATSGVILDYLGWAAVFYGTGGLTIVWSLAWFTLIHNSPQEHPSITLVELKFIQHNIQGDDDADGKVSASNKRPPWKKILSSGPFWAIVLGQMTETWGLYTIMTELPTYMKNVLHYDIKENALLSALPHFLTWIVGLGITRLGDFFIKRRYFSIGTVRKSCNTIGMWGSAACLLGVAYSGCDRTTTVSLLCVGVALTGGILGGVLVNLIDICSNFAGLLMGLTNTASSLSGVLAPWVAGIIIDKDPSLARWRLVFMITAGISFIGNLIFLCLSSGEEQSWNKEIDGGSVDEDLEESSYEGRIADRRKKSKYDSAAAADIFPIGMDLTTFYESPVPDAIHSPSDEQHNNSDL